jgi:type II secretory pathway pseudopilin PulG
MKYLSLNAKGLTLVEIVVACSLCVMIASGILASLLGTRYTTKMACTRMEASNVLQSYLEQERAKSYVNVQTANYPNVTLSFNGTLLDTSDDVLGNIMINVTDNGDDTKTIVSTATWTENMLNQPINRSASLTLMISEP